MEEVCVTANFVANGKTNILLHHVSSLLLETFYVRLFGPVVEHSSTHSGCEIVLRPT